MTDLSWAEHPELVRYYREHRLSPEDLYPSERRFLPWLACQASSILDTGCATGGFFRIWRFYQPHIVYMGVDASSTLIDTARRLYPDVTFLRANVSQGTEFPDRFATVVQALNWLHWDLNYAKAITELWRLADRYLFLDVRLSADRDSNLIGRQKLAFMEEWDGKTTTPYLTLAWRSFARLLFDLRPVTILSYGYWGRPAATVLGVDEQVCFAAFVLEKNGIEATPQIPTVCLDLPLAWPTELSGDVNLLPASHLESLVPPE